MKYKKSNYKIRLENIKSKLSYLDSFKTFLPNLKKSGQSYKCKSPFNPGEKTPSFFVNPRKEMWKCFSTGEGGSHIVSYLMKKEGLDFKSAIQLVENTFGLSSRITSTSALKTVMKMLNTSKVESGDIRLKQMYENKLIKFLRNYENKYRNYNMNCTYILYDYIWECFDSMDFDTDERFYIFLKNSYRLMANWKNTLCTDVI